MDARDFAQVLSTRSTPTGNGRRAARISRHDTRPAGLFLRRLDSLRHRRPGLRQHAVGTYRSQHRQRGCHARPVAHGLGGGRRRRLRARQALDGAAGVSLHAARPHRFLLRRPRALRLALRHPSPAGRPRLSFRRQGQETKTRPTTTAASAAGRSTARRPSSSRAIRPSASPYEGVNSLPGVGQSRETWTVSAFLGMRLWQGGELYYNPELLQGFGVASTVGAGGYPNGEAQKSNFPFPRYNTSRLFLRQEIGLGGERIKVASEYGQLVGRERRLAAHLPGRQVRGARPVRHQPLCRRFAHRFPQLVDLGGGRLRLSGRPGRADLRHHRRAQPAALGGAGSAISWSATSPTPTSST